MCELIESNVVIYNQPRKPRRSGMHVETISLHFNTLACALWKRYDLYLKTFKIKNPGLVRVCVHVQCNVLQKKQAGSR
jgi:hypothetical protein